MTGQNIKKRKRILVVPFGWGLGHASRLIPIISELRKNNIEVLIGGGPDQLSLLHQEFTELESIELPHLRIKLSGRYSQILAIALQLPGIILYIFREHNAVKKIVRSHKIDGVISDNCYGLWIKNVPCIFITHQLWIRLPRAIKFMEKIINSINHSFIRRFDKCWIPDLPDKNNLAGDLSKLKTASLHTGYIGLLSRFTAFHKPEVSGKPSGKNLLFIISGPENQRTQFEYLVKEQLGLIPEGYSYKVIRGLPSANDTLGENWYNHVDTEMMYNFMSEADTIICRAGYSTIMDLVCIGKSAILIPTPGQVEQEYLASNLSRKGLFISYSQHEFKIKDSISSSARKLIDSSFFSESSQQLLKKEVSLFTDSLT